jgi:hypothetical protein
LRLVIYLAANYTIQSRSGGAAAYIVPPFLRRSCAAAIVEFVIARPCLYYCLYIPMYAALRRLEIWKSNGDPNAQLNLSDLGLEQLPDIPDSCRHLNCAYNNLKQLPNLPHYVQLFCQGNKLTELPKLDNCVCLNCSNNLLRQLPDLRHCRELYCSNNMLDKLPELPLCTYLDCSFNKLKVLPELKLCTRLYADKNMLLEAPQIDYNNFQFMSLIGNKYISDNPDIKKVWKIPKGIISYHKCTMIIQRRYRKWKLMNILRKHLLKGPCSIAIGYSCDRYVISDA